METTTENTTEVQGTKVAKKQKPSATYTLTQMVEMTKKLVELKLIDNKDAEALRAIRERAKAEYIKQL